jgi:rhamnulose-1-phosphate aldolase
VAAFGRSGFQTVLDQASAVAGHLWRKGWAERNAGNLSWDVTGLFDANVVASSSASKAWCPAGRTLPVAIDRLAGACLWITGSGTRMRDLARDPRPHSGVIRFSADGRGYEVICSADTSEDFRPTSELPTHASIHAMLRRRGASERAVLHTHPDSLIVLGHNREWSDGDGLNRRLWQMHPETIVVLPEGVGFVGYVLPGSLEQGLATAAALESHRVALWEKHGAVAIGFDLEEALDRVDTIDKSARLYLACRAAGFEPEGLSPANLEDLLRHFSEETSAP